MNILPKKRWHVRTKDNIARVRRDEAEAREQERQRQEKLQFAESEVRINFLRKQSGLAECQANHTDDVPNAAASSSNTTQQHVDLFGDYKSHIKTTNKDLEKEKKEEQEKYEKQIGYLTYLGQDTNEALKLRSWYEVAPKRAIVGDREAIEKDLKNKHSQDPLTLINALIPPEKIERKAVSQSNKRKIEEVDITKEPSTEVQAKRMKVDKIKTHKHKKTGKSKKQKREKRHKKDKRKEKHSKSKSPMLAVEEQINKKNMLAKLREERLRREAREIARQEALLAPKETVVPQKDPKAVATPRIVQKYNSQFNPELAKQNMV